MKKILIYFCGFLMLFFIIPIICTITPSKQPIQETLSTEVSNGDTEAVESNQYEYEKYKTIKLLHPKTSQILNIIFPNLSFFSNFNPHKHHCFTLFVITFSTSFVATSAIASSYFPLKNCTFAMFARLYL